MTSTTLALPGYMQISPEFPQRALTDHPDGTDARATLRASFRFENRLDGRDVTLQVPEGMRVSSHSGTQKVTQQGRTLVAHDVRADYLQLEGTISAREGAGLITSKPGTLQITADAIPQVREEPGIKVKAGNGGTRNVAIFTQQGWEVASAGERELYGDNKARFEVAVAPGETFAATAQYTGKFGDKSTTGLAGVGRHAAEAAKMGAIIATAPVWFPWLVWTWSRSGG